MSCRRQFSSPRSCLKILQNQDVQFVISTQVLKEFAVIMTKKLRVPPLEVKEIISDLALFEVVSIDVDMIKELEKLCLAQPNDAVVGHHEIQTTF